MGNTKIQSCFARYELKYALTQAQYEAMRRSIEPHMRPDAHPRYTISNLYYDTENFQLIRGSLDKPDYKEKLRLRSYGKVEDGDTVFLEMKKKSLLLLSNGICSPAFIIWALVTILLSSSCLYICISLTVANTPEDIRSFKTLPGPTDGS